MNDTKMAADLEELHGVLLSMLKDIDAVCRNNGIRYYLMCGSLLGAVRHHGFIPWDDDLDIGFLREDYEKFLRVGFQKMDQSKYCLQQEFSKAWPMTYSKLRLNGTTFIENPNFDPEIHQGVFIDLFPIDNLSSRNFMKKIQWNAYRIIRNKHGEFMNYDLSPADKLKHGIFKLIPDRLLIRIVKREKDSCSADVHMYLGAARVKKNNEFKRADFQHPIDIQFEDMQAMAPCGWDSILHTEFNDYMKIPSVQEQINHIHAIHYDLHKDYRDFLKEGKAQ